jgi:hypothetical protein
MLVFPIFNEELHGITDVVLAAPRFYRSTMKSSRRSGFLIL